MNEDEQLSSVNWKWFCILAGSMVLAGVATYFVLPSLVSKTENDVIIISAVKTPIKVKPTEPSGKIVNHQNLLIVDILKGEEKGADQTETLRLSAPNPEPPPVNIIKDKASKAPHEAGKEPATFHAAQKLANMTDTGSTSSNQNTSKMRVKGPEITPKTSAKEARAKNKAVEKPIAEGSDAKK